MIHFKAAVAGIALALALAGYAGLSNAQAKVSNGVMVNSAGMTLYTWDKDSPGKSACNGACLSSWPLFKPSDSDKASGDWTIITREDGAKQWAYKGKPVYFYAKDAKPGDMTGDNSGGGTWHVVKG